MKLLLYKAHRKRWKRGIETIDNGKSFHKVAICTWNFLIADLTLAQARLQGALSPQSSNLCQYFLFLIINLKILLGSDLQCLRVRFFTGVQECRMSKRINWNLATDTSTPWSELNLLLQFTARSIVEAWITSSTA